jgi:putative GTP pyrophosphokinase
VSETAKSPSGEDFRRFMLEHRFGMDEIVTKLKILRDEFTHLHDYNPIESVSSRLKSPESLVEKLRRKGVGLDGQPDEIPTFDEIRSFVSDVYRVFDMLVEQQDISTVEVRDYIARPKPNGYRSLHALVEVPVFLSEGPVPVLVEVQFRTIAMDFWASLEHKIYYKYRRDVPAELLEGLHDAAETAYALDATMERLHEEVRGLDALPAAVVEELRSGGEGPDDALLDALRRLGAAPEARQGPS